MTPDPRCVCGAPVAFTVRRFYSFGVGPYEHVCPQCAPAPTDCAFWALFGAVGDTANALREVST